MGNLEGLYCMKINDYEYVKLGYSIDNNAVLKCHNTVCSYIINYMKFTCYD